MTATSRRSLTGGVIGTFVEWYDFVIYGLSAPALAAHFFPKSASTTALLGTFAIYAIAYFARPLGGLVFGLIGDRMGRINTLSTTVLLMGGATVATGLLPDFGQIGITATVLLVICRLIQGFSSGGETSGGYTYIIECAPSDRRALWVSTGICAAFLPAVLVSLTILGVTAAVGKEAYSEWGWRVPFLGGGVLSVVGLWLRRSLEDSTEFNDAARERAITGTQSKHRLSLMTILTGVLLIAVQAVSGPLLVGYMFTFLIQVGKLSSGAAMYTNLAAILLVVALLPAFGVLSDRIGRKPMMFGGTLWLLITVYPAMKLAASGTIWGAFVGQALIAISHAMFAAGGFVAILELFPTSVRYTGHAVAYNVAFALFGGTSPLVSHALVVAMDSPIAPAYYVMAIAALALVVIRFTPETRHVHLRNAVAADDNLNALSGTDTVRINTAHDGLGPERWLG
ncbi:MFS transporter [Burkholderia pseudomultivorans]|uniref:MFS transporter n=1 Tax=Burkholderia pseudomultivorans TaxID=1207504 RepID=UPI0007C788A2|nr:MFS transporter [Burkholderia pseudomultivorans]